MSNILKRMAIFSKVVDCGAFSMAAKELGITTSAVSQHIRQLENELGIQLLLRSTRSLSLTEAGRATFAPLNEASREQAASLVAHLDEARQHSLLRAMQTITALLTHAGEPPVPYILRPLQVGDIGWITHRQGLYYASELGFDESFEALVAEIAAGFVKNFDPRRERAWIAERNDEIVGSVFLMRETEDLARLRLLFVEPQARGLGIGGRLAGECIRFARAKGYQRLTLWTNAQLLAARRIYEAAGFKLVDEERGQKFGADFQGQTWMLEL